MAEVWLGSRRGTMKLFFQLIFNKSFLSFQLLVERGTCCGSLLLPSQLSVQGGTFYLQNISFITHFIYKIFHSHNIFLFLKGWVGAGAISIISLNPFKVPTKGNHFISLFQINMLTSHVDCIIVRRWSRPCLFFVLYFSFRPGDRENRLIR